MNWDDFRQRIKSEETKSSPTSRSITTSLLDIADRAEKWGLDPDNAMKATSSNLREIISRARWAIRENDKERLAILFEWAANKSTKKLRIDLRGSDREKIVVLFRKPKGKEEPVYILELSDEQFEYISNMSEQKYDFIIKAD